MSHLVPLTTGAAPRVSIRTLRRRGREYMVLETAERATGLGPYTPLVERIRG